MLHRLICRNQTICSSFFQVIITIDDQIKSLAENKAKDLQGIIEILGTDEKNI